VSEATEKRILAYLVAESKRKTRSKDRRPLARATLSVELRVLRGFFRFLVKNKAVLYNPAREVSLGKHARRTRHAPSREEVKRLLAVGGASPADLRDLAAVEVLYSTGLRSQEFCSLDLGDVDLAGETVTVRKGKGGKGRMVPIGRAAILALCGYLEHGRPKLGPAAPALFVNRSGRRLKPYDVGNLVKVRSRKAGLEPRLSPHLLRHAFATHLLENGASIRHVQAMLGHAQIRSTQEYTHVNAGHLKETLERLDVRASLESEPGGEPGSGLDRSAF
jgi:site-specific recombinase XerD